MKLELKPEYKELADEWDAKFEYDFCYCCETPMPSCSWCELSGAHEGAPQTLLDNPNAWVEINENEKAIMLKIEKTILINGEKAGTFDTDRLITLIHEERNRISELKSLDLDNVIVNKRIKEHVENIKIIIGIMDAVDKNN